MSAPSKAIPAITPITIPAIEPPLNFVVWVLDVLAAEPTRPEAEPEPEAVVGLEAETVIVFTTPPAAVVSLTTPPVVVEVSEEVLV